MSGYPGYNGGGYAAPPQQQYQQGGYYPYELPLISRISYHAYLPEPSPALPWQLCPQSLLAFLLPLLSSHIGTCLFVNMLCIYAYSAKRSSDLSSPLTTAAIRLNLLPSLATAIIKLLRNRSMLIRYGRYSFLGLHQKSIVMVLGLLQAIAYICDVLQQPPPPQQQYSNYGHPTPQPNYNTRPGTVYYDYRFRNTC